MEHDPTDKEMVLARLHLEMAKVVLQDAGIEFDPAMMAMLMLQPMSGGGMPADPMHEEVARRRRENFKVIRGGK